MIIEKYIDLEYIKFRKLRKPRIKIEKIYKLREDKKIN